MAHFYFTVHPADMRPERLPAGCSIMLVASAWWNDKSSRFSTRKPVTGHFSSICIDSGGFTAARRWGRYPWTPQQYIDWIEQVSEGHALDFVAIMDYACERGVNRGIYVTNVARIRETIRNDLTLRRLAPHLPWLGVLQGNTLEERELDIWLRRRLGLLDDYMGIGTICKRSPAEARAVIRFYGERLPGTTYHAFGVDVRALQRRGSDDILTRVASWDSYSWCSGRGMKREGRHPDLYWREGEESYDTYTLRMAEFYQARRIAPRVDRPHNLLLF